MSTPPLRWGIVGTGMIAHKFAQALQETASGGLVAVGSRGAESAQRFAAEFGAVRAHGGYAKLLADAEVEAVYVATPHPSQGNFGVKGAP